MSHEIHADGLPYAQRMRALIALGLGITLAVLDGAIANVALPAIAADFHESAAASIWVVSAYQIAVTVSLLPLASAADIIGYRRVYLIGLIVFTLASGACALSPTLTALTLSRIVQGLGAAGIMSVNIALLRYIYPGRLLGRGVSMSATIVALGAAAGPTIASALLSVGTWPILFAINVPLGVVAIWMSWRELPHSAHARRPYDTPSAVLNVLTFGLLLLGLDGIAHGEGGVLALAQIVAALIVGVFFVRRQLREASPLLPVDLLRIPLFGLSIVTSICAFAAQMLAYVSLPFYLIEVQGRTAVEAGLLMTPWPLIIVFVAPLSGTLSDRYPSGLLGGIGLGSMTLGMLALAFMPDHAGNLDIVWRMALCGFGFGLFQAPNNRTMMSTAPRARSGGAGGMLSTARLLGQTGGAALVALIFTYAPRHGTTIVLLVGAAFAALAMTVSCLRLTSLGERRD